MTADSSQKNMVQGKEGLVHLTPSQIRIFSHLQECADADGLVVLSKATLAEQMDCSLKTIDRAVRFFRKEGLIEVVPRYGEDGGNLANAYRVVASAEEEGK